MKFFSLLVILSASLFTLSLQSEETQEAANPFLQRSIDFAKRHNEFKNLIFKDHEEEFVNLSKNGQYPKTLFIGCSDSRVIPELISSARPGDLFVIRTAGNFVPYNDPAIMWDGVAATIEYAVEVLGVTDIIVCGHSQCGAIEGLFQDIKLKSLVQWLRFGHEAKRVTLAASADNETEEQKFDVAEHLSILFQLDHLLTYPYVKEKVLADKIHLHGWHFNIRTGVLEFYNPEKAKFLPVNTLLKQ